MNLSKPLRFLSVDMINKANSGHPGGALGFADVATCLFSKHLKFNPKKPKWQNRDRFILSNGHVSALLYSLFFLLGYEDCSIEDLKDFRQINSKTAGHPEYGMLEGIETTTGPLGQGIATAVGIALGEKITRQKNPNSGINHKTFVVVGDGCLQEGISYEATAFAGHHKLKNLIVLWDNNSITIDGNTNQIRTENMRMRFESIGWNVLSCDGHNQEDIDEAITKAKASELPTFIDCKTVIAKECKELEGSEKSHGSPIGGALREQMSQDLDWNNSPFEIPKDLLDEWKKIGSQYENEYNKWMEKYGNFSVEKKLNEEKLIDDFFDFKKERLLKNSEEATRNSFQNTLPILLNNVENLIGGSADLTPSNKTFIEDMLSISSDNANGNYIHYGVREHAMGAIMNGLSLYGFKPYAGTFFMFLDYMKPAIRLSALMKQPTVFVATHDSIAVGEDGPTHQPIEHLESFRAIPNLNVFRPCDAIETAECVELAFLEKKTPSILALSRQKLPQIRKDFTENMSTKGGYLVKECVRSNIIFIASGSDVSRAMEISEMLFKNRKMFSCVVSMPCRELFDLQSQKYKDSILPMDSLKVVIESGTTTSWYKYADFVFGLDDFGHSGKPKDVEEKMNFTAEQIYIELMKIVEDL
ncbi:MAG: transketolase [Alphaproteobacteria bacterium]|nr:MAG: transketolase [Rickettsiaceae bacterium 4572_127]